MRPWSRATVAEYRRLTLRAHSLLADVPVHDVWRVELPGGGPSRTMRDVRSALEAGGQPRSLNPPVRALFALRGVLGWVFRWDRPVSAPEDWSFRTRLTKADRRESVVEAGTLDGPFTVLYVHPKEAVSEIRNATVHAFLVWALESAAKGYRLYWAIHVLPVGGWTKPYLALIDPFRRWLVYPALLTGIHEAWSREYGSAASNHHQREDET